MGAHTHLQAVRPPQRARVVYGEAFVPERTIEEEIMLSSAHLDPAPSGGDQGWLKSSWR